MTISSDACTHQYNRSTAWCPNNKWDAQKLQLDHYRSCEVSVRSIKENHNDASETHWKPFIESKATGVRLGLITKLIESDICLTKLPVSFYFICLSTHFAPLTSKACLKTQPGLQTQSKRCTARLQHDSSDSQPVTETEHGHHKGNQKQNTKYESIMEKY